MDIDNITRIARTAMGKRTAPPTREPGWIYHHGIRTAKIALWLREQLGAEIDPDILYTGALFHDLGKEFEPHNESGVIIAREILKQECTTEELDEIVQIIRFHNQRRKEHDYPPTITIVQDADALDHVGIIDVWMAFYWNGVHRDTFQDHVDYFRSEQNARYRHSLREYLNYDISREEFDRRVAYEDKFFEHFRRIYQAGI